MSKEPTPKTLDLSKLSDENLEAVINNLRMLLDLHIDEKIRRVVEVDKERPEN
jgi:hypothetical protein